jgi:hypothetical protein
MAEKNFLGWLGFKDEVDPSGSVIPRSPGGGTGNLASSSTPTLDRIRELEAELADLRSRRDITSLTREEFEILATETATTLIKAAQSREAKAVAAAKSAIAEAQRAAKQLTDTAESKAHSVLQSAEGRGRKYLEAAELEAKEAIASATKAAQDLIDTKNREAANITSTARREAERAISEATTDIGNFRNWLSGAVAESERLQKIQNQALIAAEENIRLSKAKIAQAFERLSSLGLQIGQALDEHNRPNENEFTRAAAPATKTESVKRATSSTRKSAATAGSKARKSAGNSTKRK